MIPEAELIEKEMLLRLLAMDNDVKLSKQSIVRWLSLTFGLISPNESRDSFFYVFERLLDSHKKGGLDLDSLIEEAKTKNISEKTIYYHILKLKRIGLITKQKKTNKYVFGNGYEKDLRKIFKEVYQKQIAEIYKRLDIMLNSLEFYLDED